MERILITYATRTGSTEGVAKTIGVTLSLMGETVDVIPMQDVKDSSAYKAVIAGSAIQAANWLPEAMDFVKDNREVLTQKPFAA
ncbi:MAG TPA: flavodoxin domain-containing protein, partial [Bacteroidales bacterium]|nr:flavodoxin domain-containing protein [Bacteroidales bacterium]